jgi:DNA-3-methyladenine glycosylase II
MAAYALTPKGPYDLANQNEYFGGWPTLGEDDNTIVVALPVEGWQASAAVVVSQDSDSKINLKVYGADGQEEKAKEQVLATLSLNVDATDWPEIGKSDEHISQLQTKYKFLRPILFSSPYEAATHFIIGHRISMKQGRAIRARMAEELGTKVEVEGQIFAAFPDPVRLLKVSEFPGLNASKIERLHGVAEAALAGRLDRAHLLKLPVEQALEELKKINGVGPFFASGILNRGAGIVDDITDDDLTKYAVKVAYNLLETPTQAEVLSISENWKPFRMWAEVLMHVWLRREIGLPRRRP